MIGFEGSFIEIILSCGTADISGYKSALDVATLRDSTGSFDVKNYTRSLV